VKTYHWIANSFAAPICSDTSFGFIDAETAMEALMRLVTRYRHPYGLYAAIIETCEPKPRTVARYLSSEAATIEGMTGNCRREYDILYVNGIAVKPKPEKWEDLEEAPFDACVLQNFS